MKKIACLIGLIILAGCTGSENSFEAMRVTGLIPSWESGVPGSFDVSAIVSGGSGYYGCALIAGTLPLGTAIGGYNGCEISGTITLNSGTSKLITPPFIVLVSDDFGNYLNVSVSLTIVEEAPQVYGNYFECVIGQSCNKRLASVSGGSPPYTYRLGSMIYGAMPPGTAVGVDGYLTGTPTTEGEYSFELCVIDSNDIISCSYPSINVVSDESELGQNWLYSNDYEESNDEIVTLTVLKAGSSEPSMIYLETYDSVLECAEYPCIFTFDKDESVKLNSFFGFNTYFEKWEGAECYLEGIIDYDLNRSECLISMDHNLTVTAYFNKRPTVKIISSDCIFDRYHPNDSPYADYSDSKAWGYHTFTVSGNATAGTIGSVLEVSFWNSGIRTLDCGSWTKETLDEEQVCVRKSTDPESTFFTMTNTDFWTQGYVTPWEIQAIVYESGKYSYLPYATDNSEQECEW